MRVDDGVRPLDRRAATSIICASRASATISETCPRAPTKALKNIAKCPKGRSTRTRSSSTGGTGCSSKTPHARERVRGALDVPCRRRSHRTGARAVHVHKVDEILDWSVRNMLKNQANSIAARRHPQLTPYWAAGLSFSPAAPLGQLVASSSSSTTRSSTSRCASSEVCYDVYSPNVTVCTTTTIARGNGANISNVLGLPVGQALPDHVQPRPQARARVDGSLAYLPRGFEKADRARPSASTIGTPFLISGYLDYAGNDLVMKIAMRAGEPLRAARHRESRGTARFERRPAMMNKIGEHAHELDPAGRTRGTPGRRTHETPSLAFVVPSSRAPSGGRRTALLLPLPARPPPPARGRRTSASARTTRWPTTATTSSTTQSTRTLGR